MCTSKITNQNYRRSFIPKKSLMKPLILQGQDGRRVGSTGRHRSSHQQGQAHVSHPGQMQHPGQQHVSHQQRRKYHPQQHHGQVPVHGGVPPPHGQGHHGGAGGHHVVAPTTGEIRSGHLEVQSLYGSGGSGQLTVNAMNAPNNSTMQCGCENIDCPFCNLMMSVQMSS